MVRILIWSFPLALGLLCRSATQAQAPLEERPLVIDARPKSTADIERQKAEEIIRDAQATFGLGMMRYRGDRWIEAVQLLERAAKIDPNAASPWRALVPIYLSLAREEDALVACKKVLERDADDCTTAFELAKLYKANGQMREAIDTLAKGVASKRAGDRADLLYSMLEQLADLQEKQGNSTLAMQTYRKLADHLLQQRAWLVGSETLSSGQHAVAVALAFERIGHCQLKEKKYADAIKSFLESRDYLAKQPDALTKLKAVRLNLNLAEVRIAEENWTDALSFLDVYLNHAPIDAEPYEKKIALLKKLNRGSEIVPALTRYAAKVPDALSVQVLYAKELATDPALRGQAERAYLELAERFHSADVYRGLFRIYQAENRMTLVLDKVDAVYTALQPTNDVGADVREKAREQGRTMLQVLKSEPSMVAALLGVAERELSGRERRSIETWYLLAGLAAHARILDKAEVMFRHCLTQAPPHQEASIYVGLLEVLRLQKKHDAIIAVCRRAIDGPRKAQATDESYFHRSLALAYSEKEKFDEALSECDKLIKMKAGRANDRCLKARILAAADRLDAAVAECELLLKEVTQASEIKLVRYTLSMIYHQKNDHDKSEAQLLKILEDDPSDPGANNDLGYHWADRNRNLDEAERMIRRAIEVDRILRRDSADDEPDNAAYLDSLGWVLFRKGKLDEARDWLEKAAALHMGAEDPTVWDHLGDVYFRLKQKGKAKESYQAAIKLYEHDRRGKKEGRLDEAKRKLKMVTE
jgi:tetratricopeptide (TPR) repeat protein